MIKKAVIPAAGLGTRLLPLTKAQPKEMLPILDKPTIQYVVEEAIQSGITDILIITGKGKRAIEDHFDRAIEIENLLKERGRHDLLEKIKIADSANIQYIRQKEPLGLGHAILCAKTFVGNEPFAVLLGDDIINTKEPCIKQLINKFIIHNSPIIGAYRIPKEKIEEHGILYTEKINNEMHIINDLIEKPKLDEAKSNLAIIGRYILTPDIFPILENIKPGYGGEIQLTDALRILKNKTKIYALELSGTRYDVGDIESWLKANIELAKLRGLI